MPEPVCQTAACGGTTCECMQCVTQSIAKSHRCYRLHTVLPYAGMQTSVQQHVITRTAAAACQQARSCSTHATDSQYPHNASFSSCTHPQTLRQQAQHPSHAICIPTVDNCLPCQYTCIQLFAMCHAATTPDKTQDRTQHSQPLCI
jgi:hypothetical protein